MPKTGALWKRCQTWTAKGLEIGELHFWGSKNLTSGKVANFLGPFGDYISIGRKNKVQTLLGRAKKKHALQVLGFLLCQGKTCATSSKEKDVAGNYMSRLFIDVSSKHSEQRRKTWLFGVCAARRYKECYSPWWESLLTNQNSAIRVFLWLITRVIHEDPRI